MGMGRPAKHDMNDIKVYVKVVAEFDITGTLMPRELTWENGRKYTIDRVTDIRPSPAPKAGSQGDRYTIRVSGKESYLYFERNASIAGNNIGRWFVERRRPV